MVALGVELVPDGKALSSLEEVKSTFSRIKHVATELELPNAHNVSMKMIKSTISDKASTQRCFNRHLSAEISPDDNSESLVEAFCGMHLGVHLRTAAVKGMDLVWKNGSIHTTGCIIDTCVHAVCKLLGHLGVSPEYGHGVTGISSKKN